VEKITLAVRKPGVSRNNGGPIEGPIEGPLKPLDAIECCGVPRGFRKGVLN